MRTFVRDLQQGKGITIHCQERGGNGELAVMLMVQDGDKNSPSRKEDQNVPASEKGGGQYGIDKRCTRSLPWSKAA